MLESRLLSQLLLLLCVLSAAFGDLVFFFEEDASVPPWFHLGGL